MANLFELLNDISAESPCGDSLEYDPAYLEIATNIVGKPEDPITGEKAQPPNWRDIHRDALALLSRTKDLQIVIYLLRALIHVEGITGFRDGLVLLLGSLEKYWDSIHPLLDPDDGLDPTTRMNILEELSHHDSVLRPLSLMDLVDSKTIGHFSLRDIQVATDKLELPQGMSKPDIGVIKAAFLDLPIDTLKADHQAINDCVGLVQQLDSFLMGKVGAGNSANLSALAMLLKDFQAAFGQFADARLMEAEAQASEGELEAQATEGMASAPKQAKLGGVQSRQDVLKMLDLIIKYYADNEPSSPVPMLLQRAKFLVTADFMQIVQNLAPDALAQLALIKGPDEMTN